MARKLDALDRFEKYIAEYGKPQRLICDQPGPDENHLEQPKGLRTDGGGEYTSKEFKRFCQSRGIKREITIPHTPEQNRVAERAWRTLFNATRAMLKEAKLDSKWWGQAISTAAYLRNQSLTRANFPIFGLLMCTNTLHPKVRTLLRSGFLPVNFSCGVRASELALVRLRFLKYAAVDIARPHHLLSSFASFSIALVALNRVLQACSATPFCLGVWGIVISCLIPQLWQKCLNSLEVYSPPPSVLSPFGCSK